MIDMMTNDAKENNKFCQHLEFFLWRIYTKCWKRDKKKISTHLYKISYIVHSKEVVTEHNLQVDHYITLRQGLRRFSFLCV